MIQGSDDPGCNITDMDVVANGSMLAIDLYLPPLDDRADGLGNESLPATQLLGLAIGVGRTDDDSGKTGVAMKHQGV